MIVPEPRFETIHGCNSVKLIEDWIIKLKAGLILAFPKGFITDGASVPRIFWPLCSPLGDFRYGAIPHDFGYQHGFLPGIDMPGQIFNIASVKLKSKHSDSFGVIVPVYVGKDRRFFDRLFHHIILEVGIRHPVKGEALQSKIARVTRNTWLRTKTNVAYGLLRAFGWIVWNKYRKAGPSAVNSNSLSLPGV